jgi:hypothetical protein
MLGEGREEGPSAAERSPRRMSRFQCASKAPGGGGYFSIGRLSPAGWEAFSLRSDNALPGAELHGGEVAPLGPEPSQRG